MERRLALAVYAIGKKAEQPELVPADTHGGI
jgi:hypothetical protein